MKKNWLLIILIALVSCTEVTPIYNGAAPDHTTLTVKNSSKKDSVKVFLTIQQPNSVVGMFGIKPADTISRSQGYFYAKRDSSYTLDHPTALYGWNISFEHQPVNCWQAIDAGYNSGINIVEGSINTEFEVFDISCVDGTNAIIKVSVSDSINWTTGLGNYIETFKSTQNASFANNCNIRGVFPYRFNSCNQVNPKDAPPTCWKIAVPCSSDSICQVARTGHAGGNILIEYLK
jgi:hypothetical protein